MSAHRSYEISFRAVLDDRQVDELADTLFELGYDGACFRPLPPAPTVCKDCGSRYWSWGAHAERCTGPPPVGPEPPPAQRTHWGG